MKFINIFLLSFMFTNISFAGPRVGGGGVGFIASISTRVGEGAFKDIPLITNVSEVVFSNGEAFIVNEASAEINSVEEAALLKTEGVSGFILKNGNCITIDEIISGGSGNDPDDNISANGEGGGD